LLAHFHVSTIIKLLSIQVGLPKAVGGPDLASEWTTGFFKEPVSGPIWAGTTNLAGDGQGDLRVHGGADKAINLYPFEHYAYWLNELEIQKLSKGAFGENLTTTGAVEADVCIGDIFEIGGATGVLVQISQPRQPCWKLSRRWNIKDLAARVERTGRTGWYFRVLREGSIDPGGELRLVARSHPEWTVSLANEVMHRRKEDFEVARRLAECPALSQGWKNSLSRRAQTTTNADTSPRLRDPSAAG
jgi:MOSC domain-containing protein YiiM